MVDSSMNASTHCSIVVKRQSPCLETLERKLNELIKICSETTLWYSMYNSDNCTLRRTLLQLE